MAVLKNNQPAAARSTARDAEAKYQAHDVFDRLWLKHGWNRNAAYRWLAMRLGIPVERCHFRYFDAARCDEVIRIVRRELPNLKVTKGARMIHARRQRRVLGRRRGRPLSRPETTTRAPRSLADLDDQESDSQPEYSRPRAGR